MDFTTYISAGSLVLIPALYIVGLILKTMEIIPDKFIPVILLVVGIAVSIGISGINASAIIQGILVTGTAVYTNQLIKQVTKTEDTTAL